MLHPHGEGRDHVQGHPRVERAGGQEPGVVQSVPGWRWVQASPWKQALCGRTRAFMGLSLGPLPRSGKGSAGLTVQENYGAWSPSQGSETLSPQLSLGGLKAAGILCIGV